MKVAIVIPVYNTSAFVEKCIKSVFNQSYNDLQVIVVNDGSTDNSEKLILELRQTYDFEYIKKENGGLSSARNEALKYVKADYVFFLDSDDYLDERAIENLLVEAEGNDIVIGNYCYVYLNNIYKEKVDSKFRDLVSDKMTDFEYFDYFYGGLYGINACNKLYKTELIRESKLLFQPNSEIYAEDLLFNMKLISQEKSIKIHVIKDITYYYYQNSESITHTYKKLLAERYSACLNDYKKYRDTDKRGITFLTCNAINCICAQEKNFNEIYINIKKFVKNVDQEIFKGLLDKECLVRLPVAYKVDYGITCLCMKNASLILAIYQKMKNVFRGR